MFYHSLLSKNKSHQLDTRGQQPGRRALPRRCDTWADPSWCSAACAPQGRSPQPWWTGTSWSTSSFLLGWTWCWERYQCRALQGHINHDPLTDLNVTDFLYGEYIVKVVDFVECDFFHKYVLAGCEDIGLLLTRWNHKLRLQQRKTFPNWKAADLPSVTFGHFSLRKWWIKIKEWNKLTVWL